MGKLPNGVTQKDGSLVFSTDKIVKEIEESWEVRFEGDNPGCYPCCMQYQAIEMGVCHRGEKLKFKKCGLNEGIIEGLESKEAIADAAIAFYEFLPSWNDWDLRTESPESKLMSLNAEIQKITFAVRKFKDQK